MVRRSGRWARCHGIGMVVAGPGAQYRPPAAMRPPFGIAPRSTPPARRAPRMRPTMTLWQIESSIDSRIGDGRGHCGPPPWDSQRPELSRGSVFESTIPWCKSLGYLPVDSTAARLASPRSARISRRSFRLASGSFAPLSFAVTFSRSACISKKSRQGMAGMFDIRQTVPQEEVKAAYGFFCIPKLLRHVILGGDSGIFSSKTILTGELISSQARHCTVG